MNSSILVTTMSKLSFLALSAGLLIASTLPSQAFVDPGLSGNTAYDLWGSTFNQTSFPNSTYTNATVGWSVSPSGAGSKGSAVFAKPDGSYGYMSSDTNGLNYVYSSLKGGGAASEDPTENIASFSITETNALAGLQTVVLQLRTSYQESIGSLFQTDDDGNPIYAPSLSFNGGNQALAVDHSLIVSSYTEGTTRIGVYQELLFQWDLSSANATSFNIDWKVTNHAQIYEINLLQGDQFSEAIPEPSTYALLGASAIGLLALRRRKA